jgi:hypothetical protein
LARAFRPLCTYRYQRRLKWDGKESKRERERERERAKNWPVERQGGGLEGGKWEKRGWEGRLGWGSLRAGVWSPQQPLGLIPLHSTCPPFSCVSFPLLLLLSLRVHTWHTNIKRKRRTGKTENRRDRLVITNKPKPGFRSRRTETRKAKEPNSKRTRLCK